MMNDEFFIRDMCWAPLGNQNRWSRGKCQRTFTETAMSVGPLRNLGPFSLGP